MSERERRAVRTFREHGARLDDEFTDAELRRSFRRLARSLHPDAHPHRSEIERHRLGMAFDDVRRAYLVLARAALAA